MPRPAKDDPRAIKFTVRLSNAEARELEQRAERARCSPTAYARRAILGEFAETATTTTTTASPPLDPAAVLVAYELRKIGTNVNQMAHRCHELGVPPPDDLPETLAQIRDFIRQALKLR